MRAGGALVALAAALLAGCGGGEAPDGGAPVELTVSAAASLKEALEVIAPEYERTHPGVRLRLNLGSSGTLQQQIERGAPVDLFLSAARRQMDELERKGLLLAGTRRDFTANALVLVVPRQGGAGVSDFRSLASPAVRRVAMGAPGSVPAGTYADEVLRSLGLAEAVLAKAVLGQDVRQVLTYVERGEVDAGIVYASDAHLSDRVRVVATAPPGSHAPILYPLAVVRDAPHPEEARALAEYLLGEEARAVLQGHGFRAP